MPRERPPHRKAGRNAANDNLFVGGFPSETTEQELAALFGACGKVVRVKILLDRETQRPRGLAFIKMASEIDARTAITKLNDSKMGSRKIFVTEARPGGSAGNSSFVERRSGKDRRRARGASAGGPKKWERKPGGSGGRKPWDRKPEDRFIKFEEKEGFRQGKWEPRPGGSGGKRTWAPKPEDGFKKFKKKEGSGWKKPRTPKPKDGFAKFKKKKGFGPKKWNRRPGGFGPKKHGRRPGGFFRGGKSGGRQP